MREDTISIASHVGFEPAVVIGAIADIHRRVVLTDSVDFDPLPTSRGLKFRSAAVSCPTLACYPLDELGGAPTGFRTFQDFPKDLPSRSVAR